jgi:hypothetical protein
MVEEDADQLDPYAYDLENTNDIVLNARNPEALILMIPLVISI